MDSHHDHTFKTHKAILDILPLSRFLTFGGTSTHCCCSAQGQDIQNRFVRLKSIVMVTIHAKNEGSTMLGLGCRWGWLDLGWVSFSNLRTSVISLSLILDASLFELVFFGQAKTKLSRLVVDNNRRTETAILTTYQVSRRRMTSARKCSTK